MKFHAIRLSPDEDLKKQIQQFVEEKSIEAAAIISCVGSLKTVSLRMADQKKATVFQEKMEILSLSGTLSHNGSHLHMSVSDKNGRVRGGHLLDGNMVYTTAEIIIAEIKKLKFTREMDAKTGYKELRIIKTKKKNKG